MPSLRGARVCCVGLGDAAFRNVVVLTALTASGVALPASPLPRPLGPYA